ncbi:MAG TPA: C4-dicarboxylate transporter DctA [Bradyrhizobium sp.]|nr:C4-dicarboxylate transporter DctA [Bradyrhizobium sp.]
MSAKSLGSKVYVQVLLGLVLGAVVGELYPQFGASLKVVGDLFIKLIRMVIAPIVFLTIAIGLARMSDLKKVGRVGLIAVVYFEIITTIALLLGFIAGHLVAPGSGMHVRADTLDAAATANYVKSAQSLGLVDQIMGIVPSSWAGAFVQGEGVQVLFVALLFGFALMLARPLPSRLVEVLEDASQTMFTIVGLIMRLAPIAAFGAMAFTVGRYGVMSLVPLLKMVLTVYGTSFLFVILVLGAVTWIAGIPLGKLLKYTKEEILVTFGTCSSEAVMPQLINKLEALGCSKSAVGLVLPAGYAFNLDGTCLYLTLAVTFLAQALDLPLSLSDQIEIIIILMVMTKGVAGVAGIGFVTLAAVLSAHDSKIPVASLALLVGVDRFMQEARAVTSLIGNIVGTVVIAKWAGELDEARLQEQLRDSRPEGVAVQRPPVAQLQQQMGE